MIPYLLYFISVWTICWKYHGKNNVYDIKTGASRFLMSFGKKIRFVSHWFLRLKKHSQSNWVSPRLQTALVGLKAICKIQDPRQTPWTELRRWKMRTWTWKVKRKLLRMSSVKSLLNSKTWRFLKLPLMIQTKLIIPKWKCQRRLLGNVWREHAKETLKGPSD